MKDWTLWTVAISLVALSACALVFKLTGIISLPWLVVVLPAIVGCVAALSAVLLVGLVSKGVRREP